MSALSMSKSVLDRKDGGLTYVLFGQDDVVNEITLAITRDKWEDFGRPDQITVTVQAGDLLNEEVQPEPLTRDAQDVGGDDDPADVLGVVQP